MDQESFQILSSLRYDPALPETVRQHAGGRYPEPQGSSHYLLPYHKDRLLNAAVDFGWQNAETLLRQDLTQFVQTIDASIPDKTKSWRLRIVVDRNGLCTIEPHSTPPLSLISLLIPDESRDHGSDSLSSLWSVYLDSEPTVPSAFTKHKTTARDVYTAARGRAGISSFLDPAEVLLFNPKGEIMEGSITTPYFRRRRSALAGATANGDATGSTQWITPPSSSGGNVGTTRRFALKQGFCVEEAIKATDLEDGEECWLSNGVKGFIKAIVVLKK